MTIEYGVPGLDPFDPQNNILIPIVTSFVNGETVSFTPGFDHIIPNLNKSLSSKF